MTDAELIAQLREDYRAACERAERAEAACRKMAYNWRAHSSFLTIDNYVKHASDCAADPIACACGAMQSVATFRAGRAAIDSAVPHQLVPERSREWWREKIEQEGDSPIAAGKLPDSGSRE